MLSPLRLIILGIFTWRGSWGAGNLSLSFIVPSSCGHTPTDPRSNPLVSAGLIPPHLHDILVISETRAPKKKLSRVVTKARVITSDEYLEELQKKEKEKEEKEREKENRKRENKKKAADMKKQDVQKREEERQKKEK